MLSKNLYQQYTQCENEEMNIGGAVCSELFGTSCEFSGQVRLMHFTSFKVYEIPACQ